MENTYEYRGFSVRIRPAKDQWEARMHEIGQTLPPPAVITANLAEGEEACLSRTHAFIEEILRLR
jgi:hypothetical protein